MVTYWTTDEVPTSSKMNRMTIIKDTWTNISSMTDVEDGQIVYDTTYGTWKMYKGGTWYRIPDFNLQQEGVLYYNQQDNSYYSFPLTTGKFFAYNGSNGETQEILDFYDYCRVSGANYSTTLDMVKNSKVFLLQTGLGTDSWSTYGSGTLNQYLGSVAWTNNSGSSGQTYVRMLFSNKLIDNFSWKDDFFVTFHMRLEGTITTNNQTVRFGLSKTSNLWNSSDNIHFRYDVANNKISVKTVKSSSVSSIDWKTSISTSDIYRVAIHYFKRNGVTKVRFYGTTYGTTSPPEYIGEITTNIPEINDTDNDIYFVVHNTGTTDVLTARLYTPVTIGMRV